MQQLAEVCEAVAGTSKKTEKVALVARLLRSRRLDEAAVCAVFLSGRVFPAFSETTLQAGGALLWRLLLEASGKSEATLTAAYRRHGDLGASAYDVLRSAAPPRSTLNVLDLAAVLQQVAGTSGPAAKSGLLRPVLERATALEAKYIVKIISGDLRIGLRESLVEEAIAQAYGADFPAVRRANMLLGDIAETLRLAATSRLQQARLRLFHPVGFMLASPVETAAEALQNFQQAAVEDKYDGIRAQAHCGGHEHQGKVRLFSRTLDDVTAAFPELPPALRAFPQPCILDGEIVAWQALAADVAGGKEGRALPFSELQKRLGRKQVTAEMMRAVPVAFVAFDVLYADGDLVIDRPLAERARILDELFARRQAPGADQHAVTYPTEDAQGRLVFEPAAVSGQQPEVARVIRAPVRRAHSSEHLEQMFDQARARGNEGLMVKDLNAPYLVGRRGRSWLKLKRELATLDVVVTAAEYGHGRRAGVLSDYTFAVRAGERLLNIGKAYSGLTDEEIAELTEWFLAHTLQDRGFLRLVEPHIVLEVAFNNIMRSDRHDSGYALRFPRILRIRHDKSAGEIDTLEQVKQIYQRQQSRP